MSAINPKRTKAPSAETALVPESRAPPPQACLGDPISSIELKISPINNVTALLASEQSASIGLRVGIGLKTRENRVQRGERAAEWAGWGRGS